MVEKLSRYQSVDAAVCHAHLTRIFVDLPIFYSVGFALCSILYLLETSSHAIFVYVDTSDCLLAS